MVSARVQDLLASVAIRFDTETPPLAGRRVCGVVVVVVVVVVAVVVVCVCVCVGGEIGRAHV